MMEKNKQKAIRAGVLGMLTVFLLAGAPAVSEARMAYNGGVPCWNGDLNYPFVSMGNRIGSFVDVSSAYVVENNSRYTEVKISWQSAEYTSDNVLDYDTARIRHWKSNGQLQVAWHGEFHNPGTADWKLLNDAYYLIACHLGI